MATYTLEKTFETRVKISENVTAVSNMFGIGGRQDRDMKIIDNCRITINKGQIVYITGGSGAGKSLILKLLKEQMPQAIDLDEMAFPSDKPLVDCFDGASLQDTLNWLSMAGMSDAFAILRSAKQLSDGQRYRFRLAKAMAEKPAAICIDEFCATLDRVTAAVVAHNVRKFAQRFKTTFIVATSHDDLLEDLCPDVVVVKHLGSGCDVYYPGGG